MNLKNYFSYKSMNFVTFGLVLILWYICFNLINTLSDGFMKISIFFLLFSMIIMLFLLLVNKFGFIFLFYIAIVILGVEIPGFEAYKASFYLPVINGFLFEIMFLLLYMLFNSEIKSKLFTVAIMNFLLLSMITLFTAAELFAIKLFEIFNLSFIIFIISLAGGLIAVFLWYHVRTSKYILDYEYKND